MAVVSHRLKLMYFPIPKNACTSAKCAFFEADANRPFMPNGSADEIENSIHKVYPSLESSSRPPLPMRKYDQVVILRDPIARFNSGFRNRILHLKDLKTSLVKPQVRERAQELSLSLEPSLDEFVERLEDYMAAYPMVRHHFLPQHRFVAKVLPTLSLVIGLSRLNEFTDLLSRKAEREIKLPHLQTGGADIKVPPLSTAAVDKLKAFYAADYELNAKYGIEH